LSLLPGYQLENSTYNKEYTDWVVQRVLEGYSPRKISELIADTQWNNEQIETAIIDVPGDKKEKVRKAFKNLRYLHSTQRYRLRSFGYSVASLICFSLFSLAQAELAWFIVDGLELPNEPAEAAKTAITKTLIFTWITTVGAIGLLVYFAGQQRVFSIKNQYGETLATATRFNAQRAVGGAAFGTFMAVPAALIIGLCLPLIGAFAYFDALIAGNQKNEMIFTYVISITAVSTLFIAIYTYRKGNPNCGWKPPGSI